MEKQKISLIGLFLLTALATTLIFQNCSKVNYDIPPQSDVHSSDAVERVVIIDPQFSDDKANLKVLFVVDDSYTMSLSQDRLANAVDSLIDPLAGRNVDFKIVSTSGIPGNEIDNTISKKYFDLNGAEISETQATGLAQYHVEKNITNTTNGRHVRLQALRDFTPAQFSNLKNKIKSVVVQVGANGSDKEEGICSSLRTLFDESAGRFFQAGDKAAIIVLSDEDDASDFAGCVSRYRERISNQPTVFYNYLQQRAKLTLEYQVERDGITTWIPVSWGIGLPNGQYFQAGQSCNPSDLSIATTFLAKKGYVIRNISACTYEATPTTNAGVDFGDNGIQPGYDACAQPFTHQGINYQNLYAYVSASNLSAVSGSCKKLDAAHTGTIAAHGASTSVIAADMINLSMQDLKAAFTSRAIELFGSRGFIFAPIIRKSGESCSLQQGQSYGLQYEQLAARMAQNAVVESLCTNDYGSVLGQVSQFIVRSSDNSYVLTDLVDNEKVVSVAIKRAGAKTLLTRSQYEIVGSTLTLLSTNLNPGDALEIGIGTKSK